jgi:hypothetical protein
MKKRAMFMTCAALACLAGMAVRASAVPTADLSRTSINSADPTYNWPAPGTGSMNAYSGDIYVLGTSSLTTPGDNPYNAWRESSALTVFSGTIHNAEDPWWNVSAQTAYNIDAKATYNPTNPVVVERHRAETTLQIQAWGHVSAFLENQAVVDTVGFAGDWWYTTTGADGSTQLAMQHAELSTAPAAGTAKSEMKPNLNIGGRGGVWLNQTSLSFYLWAHGKQYIHNDNEEDAVSLNTNILAADPSQVGWRGYVNAYDLQAGVYVHIAFTTGYSAIP